MVFQFLKFGRNKPCCSFELILSCGSIVAAEVKEGIIFNGDRSKVDQFLQAVDEIQLWTESATILDDQIEANTMIQIAMARLEDEFQIILISLPSPISTNSHTDPRSSTCSGSTTDSTTGFDDFNYVEFSTKFKQSIDDLRSIAVRMNSAGHIAKCVKVYQNVRKFLLNTCLQRLGIQKSSIDELRRMDWEALEEKVRQWIRAAKICVTILYTSEKRLCEHIFGGLGNDSDEECFVEMVKDHAIQLFKFGEAISICLSAPSRRPEKLFKILDLHKALLKFLPDLDVLFQLKSLECIRTLAAYIVPLLVEVARGVLPELEYSVLHEQSSFQEQRGRISNLTTYVMAYVTRISSYKETLTELIISKPSKQEDIRNSSDRTIPDMKLYELEGRTPLVVHLIYIIEILQYKLDGKSKCYKDASLAQLFMMNNVQYIVQKVQEDSKLGDMIGNNYLEKLTENVRLLMAGYLKSTWVSVTSCLREEGLYVSRSLFSGVSKSALKDRLKTFNATFEEVRQTQARWVVPNVQLRKKLRLSILDELIPPYNSFIKLFKSHIGSENHQQKYIRYSVEDLKTSVSNFFVGIVEV
ncbi:exocyst complex component EXO70A1-like [Cornus florida]|uniref:exocyst complex component EXO70A1-like n=1 Tax=Cornus florida TaxID=4283 RepID=UPI00289CD9D5|nr:exocyst complex component EXO70A1-like [Cornus florida]